MWLLVALGVGLAVPAFASAAGAAFDPAEEFATTSWVDINLGFVDLSINKAVFYMLASSLIICVFGIVVVRGLSLIHISEPTRPY